MNASRLIKVRAVIALLVVGFFTVRAMLNTREIVSSTPEDTQTQPTETLAVETDVPAAAESTEPVRIESNGEVPFYARFGENETFSNGEWAVIIFYRSPECIPADFNLNQFFHFPGDSGPGAFGCTPPTTTSIEYWATGPETDPAPLVAEMTGRGAVPVWFIALAEVEAALTDGVVTIGELAESPSLLKGEAANYTELLHPGQSNAQSLIQFKAEGTLEDGRSFMVDVSSGAPDVEDHTTIEIQ
ncbi:MAG TPA: hypothetical protein VMN99_04750 [Anaerolineales bacterium]|nr:hypothetical protein [Anaerolineales bacterium]